MSDWHTFSGDWSGRRDSPAGTARAENPFLRRQPQKLVEAVPAERERLERKSTVFYFCMESFLE